MEIRGIDVSRHNGTVDWAKVKAAGARFALIRAGWGGDIASQDDPTFAANVAGCEAQGLDWGCLLYTSTALAKLFKNLSKEVGNIAKMVLPPLTKAFGLVVDNLDVLVPLTIAAVAGIKGFQIASAVATKIGKLQKSIAATAAATTAERCV